MDTRDYREVTNRTLWNAQATTNTCEADGVAQRAKWTENRGEIEAKEELRASLRPDKPLGAVLQGMRRQLTVTTRGSGKATRYYLP